MRILSIIILLASLGCASSNEFSESRSTESRSHLDFVFPADVGSFHLQDYHVYRDPAYGVVGHYRISAADPLIVSVYAFPSPRTADGAIQPVERHARDELMGLLDYYPSGRQTSWPEHLVLPGPEGREMYQAALEIHDAGGVPFYSFLRLIDYGESRLKFRFSYPGKHPSAPIRMREFQAQYPFP